MNDRSAVRMWSRSILYVTCILGIGFEYCSSVWEDFTVLIILVSFSMLLFTYMQDVYVQTTASKLRDFCLTNLQL